MKSKLVFLMMLSLNLSVFSQEGKHKEDLIVRVNKTDGYLSISDLEKNGINSKLLKSELPLDELQKIRDFNFDQYRDYSKVQLVQISNGGPILELYSIEKLINEGFVFDSKLIEDKKGINYSGVTHQTMPVVNIGFRVKYSDLLK